jgi:hypothetical protein
LRRPVAITFTGTSTTATAMIGATRPIAIGSTSIGTTTDATGAGTSTDAEPAAGVHAPSGTRGRVDPGATRVLGIAAS